jgi:hypothetical protein
MGIGSFAQGAFGALQGASQARARNRAAIQSYEHALRVRKHEWYQQLSVWGAKRNKYFTDLNENDLAAQRGYSQAQVGLNRVFEGAAQNNEKALIQYLQKHGQLTAKGRTGKSIDRLNTLELGKLERFTGRQAFQLTRSREEFKQNVENIRSRQISGRSRLHANVTFAPMPDLAPPPPQLENESAMGGILMAGVGGLMAYSKAGGKFGRGVQAGGGQTTGGSYGYTPSEGLYEPDYVYPSQEWTSDMPSGVDVSGANSWGSTRYRSARQRRGY